MKRLASTIVGLGLLCLAATAHAVPATVSFTGRLTTTSGPVEGNVALRFSLYDRAVEGAEVWAENRPAVAAMAGLVHVDLGAMTTLDEDVLTGGALFLEVRVGNEILAPRLALQSVPYAIRAAVADRAELLGTVAPDEVVTGIAGTGGITATRSGNLFTLAINTATVQSRITGSCGPNASIASVSATGTVTCEADSDTTYAAAAGGGLALGGSGFGLSACAAGQIMKAGAGGTWSCGADGDTTYTAGGGVAIVGSSVGLIACPSGQVLKAGASAGTWACSADLSTTYTGASGITVTGTAIATDNAVVARKDVTTAQNFAGSIGINAPTPREKLEVGGPVRLDTMRVFRKYGNNGAASCEQFCQGTMWPGGRGTCLAARRAVTGAYVSCDAVPGAGTDLSCMCAGIDE